MPRDTASHMENGKILENGKKPLNNSNSAVATLTSRLDLTFNPVELEVRLNRNLLYQLPRIHLRLRLGTDKTLVFVGFLSQFIADIADLFLSWICRRVPHLPGSRRLMQIIRLYLHLATTVYHTSYKTQKHKNLFKSMLTELSLGCPQCRTSDLRFWLMNLVEFSEV